MQQLPFVTLDVFTRTRYRGNPLAIVSIPPDIETPLTHGQKLAIAKEFNLSETVFVHEKRAEDEEDATSREIDIFLTDGEIPFAGHPTVGTAVVLLPRGITRLLTKAGPIGISPAGDGAARVQVPHSVHLHERCLGNLRPGTSGLQPEPSISELERSAPLFSIVRGVTFALVELPSLDLLSLVRPTGATFPAGELLDQGWNKGHVGRYYFVRMPDLSATEGSEDGTPVLRIRCRLVLNNFEDPATGAAASCLASYLSTVGEAASFSSTRSRRYEITQGVEMGRESNITVDVSVKDHAIETVTLAGPAVQVMRGHISL